MKKIVITIIFVLLICEAIISQGQNMDEKEAQKTWDEYHERIKNRRIAEAKIINTELKKNNISSDTDLVLDFSFFARDENGAKGIQKQLSENYDVTITKEDEYWHINGTSRPYAVNLTPEKHLGWVEFMHDVALSYGCIFSVWSITEPKENKIWSNEDIETEFD